MAGVDVGGEGGKRRATNGEINMIPFIDLLMVTIAFLLITAVWVSSSRLDASANVPDKNEGPVEPRTPERTLEVRVGENDFALIWRQGATVLSETKVARSAADADGVVRQTELAKRIGEEWKQNGSHKDPSDRKPDQAVLQVDNHLPFKEIVAVLDAVYATKRELRGPGGTSLVPAFQTTFSSR